MNVSHLDNSQHGDIAELVLTERAMRRGYIVSKPYGQSTPYDLVVGGLSPRLRRVQVRSAWSISRTGSYRVSCHSKAVFTYTSGDIDLLAVYIAPEDTWYFIPVQALAPRLCVYFNPRAPGWDAWRRYREAWWRLGRPRRPARQITPRPSQFLGAYLAQRADQWTLTTGHCLPGV
jgi:hypothetical protein